MEKYKTVVGRSLDALDQRVKILEIDNIFGINNGDILISTAILAVKEVIYTKCKTGGPLSLLEVKTHVFSRMNLEEYWCLLANEMGLFLGNGEGLQMIYENLFNLTYTQMHSW